MITWDWFMDGWIVAVGVLAAVSCALPGNFLVLRRMSLMGDAISHAVLPGLAIAFLITESRAPLPMFIGAVIVGTLTAVFAEAITRYGKVEHGAAMGVVFSVLFACGLVLIRQAADHVDLDPGCVLYGNLAQIPLTAFDEPHEIPPAAINLGATVVLNVLFLGLLYKELKISAFDPDLATSVGINANLMHYLLMIVVAVTTVANFEAVGSILVIAMLIVPAAAAHLLTDRLGCMIALSAVIATASAVSGHLFAVWGPGWVGLDPSYSVNSAAMIATMTGVFFTAALLASPQHGLVSKAYHRAVLSVQIIREDILGLLYRWQEMRPRPDEAMLRPDVLGAVGRGLLSRLALRSLYRHEAVWRVPLGGDRVGLRLTLAGRQAASELIRAHRLWEVYLHKHFDLPLDHLHMPAERMEHYISPEMIEQIDKEVAATDQDPHGREIPGKGTEKDEG